MVTQIDQVDNSCRVRIGGRDLRISERGFANCVEVGLFLGLTRQAVSKMAAEGKIPSRRFGRALRIPWQWLLDQERAGVQVPQDRHE